MQIYQNQLLFKVLIIQCSWILSIVLTEECGDCNKRSCMTTNNETISHDQIWFNSEDCTECRCEGGIFNCEKARSCDQPKSCLYSGQVYLHNETWSDNNCTNCICDNGHSNCNAYFCHSDVSYNNCKKMDIKCPTSCPFGYEIKHNNDTNCSKCSCKYIDLLNQLVFWVTKNFTTYDLIQLQTFLQQHNAIKCDQEKLVFTILYVMIGFLISTIVILSIILFRQRKMTSPHRHSHAIDFYPVHSYKLAPLYDTNFNMKSQQDFNLELK